MCEEENILEWPRMDPVAHALLTRNINRAKKLLQDAGLWVEAEEEGW